MLIRRGYSLVELVVALALSSIVLAIGTTSLLHQQRSASRLGRLTAGDAQRRGSASLVAADLALLSPGDLAPGHALDTALQLRAVVAAGVSCDTRAGGAIIESGDDGDDALGNLVALPRVGDTLWWHREEGGPWSGRRVTSTRLVTGDCPISGRRAGALVRFDTDPSDTVGAGTPIRVTRPARYSIYRSGAGSWQLGWTEWSESIARFAAIQPVAGPFLRIAPSGARTGFRYFDSSGAELPVGAGGAATDRVRRVRIAVISPDEPTLNGASLPARDSSEIALRRTLAPEQP